METIGIGFLNFLTPVKGVSPHFPRYIITMFEYTQYIKTVQDPADFSTTKVHQKDHRRPGAGPHDTMGLVICKNYYCDNAKV